MDVKSQFQQQFPLSPRKFWKKIIGQLPHFVVGFIFFFVVALFIAFGIAAPGQEIQSITLTRAIAIFILAVGLDLIIPLLYAIYFRAYIRTYSYDCNDNFVTIKKGVFAPTEIHVQYQKIQDVYVDQDILDRAMGLYDVHIASATATSGIEAHIDGVDKIAAEGIKDFLLHKISENSTTPSSMPLSNSANPAVTPGTFSQNSASSQTFPINQNYFIAFALSQLITSFVTALVLTGILYIYGRRLSVFEYLGFDVSSIHFFFSALGLFLFIFLIGMVSRYIWLQNYYFEFYQDFLLIREGIFYRQERHVPYHSIQDITVQQSLFDRLFHLGTLRIENATANTLSQNPRARGRVPAIVIPGQSIENAQVLLEMLKNTISSGAAMQQKTGL